MRAYRDEGERCVTITIVTTLHGKASHAVSGRLAFEYRLPLESTLPSGQPGVERFRFPSAALHRIFRPFQKPHFFHSTAFAGLPHA